MTTALLHSQTSKQCRSFRFFRFYDWVVRAIRLAKKSVRVNDGGGPCGILDKFLQRDLAALPVFRLRKCIGSWRSHQERGVVVRRNPEDWNRRESRACLRHQTDQLR